MNRLFIILLFFTSLNMSNAQPFDGVSNNFIKVRYGDMELVDLDNDNDLDLIVSGSGYTYTYRNDGNGYFSEIQTDLPNVNFASVTTGDVDGDNDLDLFVSGHWTAFSYYSKLFLNDGSGHFDSAFSPFTNVAGGDSKFFDADNDGDLDLFYFGRDTQYSSISKLYFNDGAGNFTESNQSFPPNHSGSLAIGDVNADGFEDILMSGESGSISGKTQLFVNNGDGTFTLSTQSFQGVSHGSAVLMDLERDGDLDIIVNGVTSGVWLFRSLFYENDGTGIFTNVGNRGLDSLRNNTLIFADIDDDGDDDIFLSGRNVNDQDTCALYFNDKGFFTKDSTFITQGLFDGDAVFGRLDKDCGIDLIYCGFGDVCYNESYTFKNALPIPSDCISDESPKPVGEPVTYEVMSNPFSSIIRVVVSDDVDHVWVYDERGRLVMEQEQDSNYIEIDLSNERDASYILRFSIKNTSTQLEEKLIKVAE